ncbi:MAG: hypothetical protein IJE44_05365 [Clostridia bacterium]|nr:hypothetical protein [Clostridia bacterium]MBQ6894172.1 hypothetical protein [Clostridia bacterium]
MSLNREELFEYATKHIKTDDNSDVLELDCKNIIFLLDNCEITVPESNRFFITVNCEGIQKNIYNKRMHLFSHEIAESGLYVGDEARAYTGYYDFSHTTAQWESVLSLGITGLRKRISEYAEKNKGDEKKDRFYKEISKVYDAALRFLKRASDAAAACGKNEMAEGIKSLTENAPKNLFEAMQTTIIYYVLQHMFEGTYLRTLGRLDSLFYSYYEKENKENAKELVLAYLKEIDTLKAPANTPFALGGTDEHGNSLINELSYVFVEAYKKANTNNTKFHLLCNDNTPADIIESAFEGVRNGSNSIFFMSDKKIIESLEKLGEDRKDALNYHVVGCYECGGEGELTSSCNARVNLPLALEFALNNGKTFIADKQAGLENNGRFESFDALYKEFLRQLVYMCNCAMKLTDLCEVHYRDVHSAPILSGVYVSALEKGGDLYCDYTAKYNNSSVNALGLATAVDSLAAIKKLVFEDKTMSLSRLTEILKSNWENEEPLRLLVKNKYPKFGLNDKNTDNIAKNIVDVLHQAISGKPNVKGGIYRLGLFSIDWRWEFGLKTGASADGRLSGETLSQNTSATFGADKNGATAHLLSIATIDASKTPNGTIADIDLHSSAVKGKNGINALTSTLKTFFDLGGFGVHYNILDTETLKDAKLNPEKYPNLQVRICGWNVLFSALSEKEKDEFIARSIK